MKAPSSSSNGLLGSSNEGERKAINSELWHACAGPLVSLPPVGSLVVYFPQGHSEQVAASMQKDIDSILSYPSLPSKLICVLHTLTLHADSETDEVFAQMTLQPVNKVGQQSNSMYDKEALLASEMGLKQNKQPAEFFCKTLTASDTSTHGGFSVPRRAAEKIFPPLDFSMQPPAQELVAKDLHDVSWTFRHIYRGQPKRHLLTTGWSVFVSTKRLIAGDAVLFIRDEKSQLLLGIRRSNRQQPALSSSVLSSDSMHIGILAAAAHAAANNSPFTIFYNPRTSPSEFVVPLAKYTKAMYTQVSLGMRFRMMFETEECGVRRYMGTITGISDLDPVRWKNSQWRNLQVGWDESTAGERRTRVSIWEIEPVATPFYICPPPFFRPKFLRQPGTTDDNDVDGAFRRAMPWLGDDFGVKDPQNSVFSGLNLVQWMAMQQNPQLLSSAGQSSYFPSFASTSGQDNLPSDNQSRLLNFQTNPLTSTNNYQLTSKPSQQVDPFQQPSSAWPGKQQVPPMLTQQQQQNPVTLQQNPVNATNQLQPKQPPRDQESEGQQHHVKQNQSLNNGQVLAQAQMLNQALQPPLTPIQQGLSSSAPASVQASGSVQSSMTQTLQLQQTVEQQLALLKQQQQQKLQNIDLYQQQQIQIQLLQKLQQQQVLSQLNQQMQQPQISSHQQFNHLEIHQEPNSIQFTPPKQQQQQLPSSHITGNSNAPQLNNAPLACPTSNVTLHKKNQESGDLDARGKNEILHSLKEPEQLDVSSASSFCLDGGQENFSLPPLCLDGDVQLDSRNHLDIGSNGDGFMRNNFLPRGFGHRKDVQNVLSGYGNQKDVETEVSTAGISSQSFGMADAPFKPGCSSDTGANENGLLKRGIWSSQPQRMRTYTKVQKRGSVGRSIDVTRYRGYDELRHDLACMFGIEGQLEDPHRTEWKLVYVDHEKDILLVGDDPWEEFVSCVQSIKILSAAEVQQMSLDGEFPGIGMQNQACSGDNENPW